VQKKLAAVVCACLCSFVSVTVGLAGKVWQVFGREDGLPGDYVSALFEASDGSIWIGFWDDGAGLCRYKDGEFVAYGALEWDPSDPNHPFGPEAISKVAAIAECCGTIWAGENRLYGRVIYLEGGLWRYGGWAGWGARAVAQGHDPVMGEVLLVSATDHVYKAPCPGHDVRSEFVWGPGMIEIFYSVLPASDGNIWLSVSPFGIYVVTYSGEIVDHYSGRGKLVEDGEGRIWAAGGRQGISGEVHGSPLYLIENGECTEIQGPIADAWWLDIAVSSEHDIMVLLLLTTDELVCVLHGGEWKTYGWGDGIPGIPVCTIVDSLGNIWVGTRSGLAVLWRAPVTGPTFLGVRTDRRTYAAHDEMRVLADLAHEGEAVRVDLYVALQTPSGELLFYPPLPGGMVPCITGLHIPDGASFQGYELFSLTLPDLPEGTYRWFAALTYAGTMDLASNIASCEWEFEK